MPLAAQHDNGTIDAPAGHWGRSDARPRDMRQMCWSNGWPTVILARSSALLLASTRRQRTLTKCTAKRRARPDKPRTPGFTTLQPTDQQHCYERVFVSAFCRSLRHHQGPNLQKQLSKKMCDAFNYEKNSPMTDYNDSLATFIRMTPSKSYTAGWV